MGCSQTHPLARLGAIPCSLKRGQLLLLRQPLEGSQFSGGLRVDFTLEGGRARICPLALEPPDLRKLYSLVQVSQAYCSQSLFLDSAHLSGFQALLVLNPSIFYFLPVHVYTQDNVFNTSSSILSCCQQYDWQGAGALCFWKQQSSFLFCVPSCSSYLPSMAPERLPSALSCYTLCSGTRKDLPGSFLPLSCDLTFDLPSTQLRFSS